MTKVRIRTKSGRYASVIAEAEDAQEKVGLVQYKDGSEEFRRQDSYEMLIQIDNTFLPFSGDANEDTTNKTDEFPLLDKEISAACRSGNLSILHTYVENDGDINTAYYGVPILHTAAEYAQVDAVKYLVEQGADINQQAKFGYTAMMYSMHNTNFHCRRLNILEYLLETGADATLYNTYGWSVLHFACCHGHTASVKLLLQDTDIDVNSSSTNIFLDQPYGSTPRSIAKKNNHDDIVDLLDKQIKERGIQLDNLTAYQIAHFTVLEEGGIFNSEIQFCICQYLATFRVKYEEDFDNDQDENSESHYSHLFYGDICIWTYNTSRCFPKVGKEMPFGSSHSCRIEGDTLILTERWVSGKVQTRNLDLWEVLQSHKSSRR